MEGIKAAAAGGALAFEGVGKPEDLKEAAEEFEALFLNQMLKTMRESVEKSELFHGGKGEELYTSMLDAELSRSMAKAGGIGLGEALLRQLKGPGEVRQAAGDAYSAAETNGPGEKKDK